MKISLHSPFVKNTNVLNYFLFYLQERERRRQHASLIQQLDERSKYEEREKKKHQVKQSDTINRL